MLYSLEFSERIRLTYTEEILAGKSIIILHIEGSFRFDEVAKLGSVFRKKALEMGFGVIVDFRKTTSNVSVGQIQSYCENYINPINKQLSEVPMVYISNDKDFPFFKLMQQIWDNRGISVVIFKELETGIKWFETDLLPNSKKGAKDE